MQSIIQSEKECFICHNTIGLHDHHIFGAANRKWSEKYGLKIWLCPRCHNMSDDGIHFRKDLMLKVKQIGQRKFGETHTREEFLRIFGRNYLP